MTEERRTSTSRRLERGPCVPGTRSTCAKCQDEKVGLLGRSAPATSPQGPGPATKPPQAHKPSSVPQSPQANSWPCGWAWSGTAWGRGSPCPRGRGRQGRDRGPEPGSELPASTRQKTPPPPRDPAPARREQQVAGAQPRGARDRAAHPHGPSRCTAADVAARRELRRTRVVRRPVAPSFLGSGRRRWGEGRRRRSAASSPAAEPAARRSSPPPPLENLGWETRWMGLVLRSPKSALISLGRPAARAEGSPGVPSRVTHHGAHAAHG